MSELRPSEDYAIRRAAKRRFSMLEPDSLLMLVAYGLAMWLLYVQSAR